MKKFIITVMSIVVLFSCSKKNNHKSQATKKPPLLTLTTNDHKKVTFDFSVDTTIVLDNMEFQLSKKDGKGIVKAYATGKMLNRNSLAGQVYKVDNTNYINDGAAIVACVSIYCIPTDASSVYVLLGSNSGGSEFCVGDDSDEDLLLVAKLSSGQVALSGQFTFETPVNGVSNKEHLDCWIEHDPVGVVKKL